MDPVIAFILARVIGCRPRAISLQSYYISVVSRALLICPICAPEPEGCMIQLLHTKTKLGFLGVIRIMKVTFRCMNILHRSNVLFQ